MTIESISGALLGTISSWARTLWRRFRFGPQVRIELGWDHLPIFIPGHPSPDWRAIGIIVTASRDEEFVVAGGTVQAKTLDDKQWNDIVDLDRHLQIPFEVPKNRARDFKISGGTLSKEIRRHLGSVVSVELRVVIHDYHRIQLVSDPIAVDLMELEREEFR